uniref:Uncharacterized protein n=1 Tax=Lactuca sativa TaxID=4236 RepID=A0A9R1VRC2_LACSA|nr:hypothetical protein LSAT_V11C400176810 [Lactuca sativa]
MVITKRSKIKSGYVSKVIFVCDRNGVYRGTNASGRNTGINKIDCPLELGHAFAKQLIKDECRMVKDMIDNDVPQRNILSNLKSQNEHNPSSCSSPD